MAFLSEKQAEYSRLCSCRKSDITFRTAREAVERGLTVCPGI